MHPCNLAQRLLLLGLWLPAVLLMTSAIPSPALATSISLGTASDFAVLALNGSHVYMGSDATIVNGDFGIGPDSFGALEKGVINGSLYLDLTSTANVTVDPAVTISGSTTAVDLSQPNSDAVAASAALGALPVNRPDVTAITANMNITADSGDNVFSLTTVDMTAKTLTLSGTADDYFIFNVTGDLHFQASNIVLSGGIGANHVIFNVIGTLPGNQIDLSANGTFRGTILAPDRAIQAEVVLVIGALIGGRDSSFDELDKDGASMSIHSSAEINHVPFEATPSESCISVMKTVAPTQLLAATGGPVTYAITVENCGDVPLSDIELNDDLLPGVNAAFLAANPTAKLAPGASVMVSLPFEVPPSPPSTDPLVNTVTATGVDPQGMTVEDDAQAEIDFLPFIGGDTITIAGGAFDDLDCDGEIDPGEPPLSGATFVLTDCEGNPVSDADGIPVLPQVGNAFVFSNLTAGLCYRVTEINPAGYVSTNSVPGIGGVKVSNDVITVDASESALYSGQAFLDGQCEQLVYQAYPGNSFGTNTGYAGYAGATGDQTTSVPGILQIVPQDAGEPPWANFIHGFVDGTYTDGSQLSNVVLVKQTPESVQCADVFPVRKILQQGSSHIRTWWPLMFEAPGTTWTLTIDYDPGDQSMLEESWTWRMDATLQSLKDTLQLFHELPFGRSQTPLVSDECLYPVLQAKLDAAIEAVGEGNLVLAGLMLGEFEMEVSDAWLTTTPQLPSPCGPGTGIAQTAENPAACKLLSDAAYIAASYGLWMVSK